MIFLSGIKIESVQMVLVLGNKMKKILISIVLIVLTSCINFGVFLYSYKKLAFPYLHETQRLENASLIFSYVLLGFLVCSILSMILNQMVRRKI